MNNWLNIYSRDAWQEAVVKQRRSFTGFPERKWRNTAPRVQVGDRLLCYMLRRGFFAVMEVTGEPYRDNSIPAILDFQDAFWIPWNKTLELPDNEGVWPPDLKELSWIKGKSLRYWPARVQQTLVSIDDLDAEIIVAALQEQL